MSWSRRRRTVAATALATAALAAAALSAPTTGAGQGGSPGGAVVAAGGEGTLGAFLRDNPALNRRAVPLAAVREKLGSGEGDRRPSDGPAAQLYDAQAFPRGTIAEAQRVAAAAAFGQARSRGDQKEAQGQNYRWREVGPTVGRVPGVVTYTGTPTVTSGRVTALAISPTCTPKECTLLVGAAGGGVWRTTNALADRPRWLPVGRGIPSNAIGSITLDPTDPTGRTVYVGTGEANGSGDSEAGVGLFRSTDAGSTFTEVTGFHAYGKDRGIGTIAVDPVNPAHLYVGTTVARHGSSSAAGGRYTPPGAPTMGVYESTDRGATWTLTLSLPQDSVDPSSATGGDFFRGGVSSIQVDPTSPSTVYAAVNAYGLYRRTGGGAWTQIYATPFPDTLSSRIEFALATLPDGRTRIYLGDATAFRSSGGPVAGLLRSDDGRAPSPSFTMLSNPTKGTPGYGSYNFCQAQCWYDMVVKSPPGQPDTVYLGGAMNYNEIFTANPPSNGRAVVRSTNAGVGVTDMTNDAAARPNGLHPDQHALVFVPGNPDLFFSGSDGGVVRQSGPFVDRSADCDRRGLVNPLDLADCRMWLAAVPTSNTDVNSGLATLQFQSVSVNPGNSRNLLGGTQDNGTWSYAGQPSSWFESVGGDGGQSGFDAGNPNIRYHSYYGPNHDVNFRGDDPLGWNWISDPLVQSGESAAFYVPLTVDPVVPGTVFDGLQHVWRTLDNGGDRAYLEKHCNEFTGDFTVPCGDWVPLGGTQGDLSSAVWGTDFAGAANYVVAVERAPSNRGTLWAGTRRGRLFVSSNADAANPAAVTYTRIDKVAGLPTRFVSGISIDPKDPNRAFVSYSGYAAYAPGGHVYEVRFDPRTGQATARDLSYDLGDQPITDVVYDARSGALFAATDFGVVALQAGERTWAATVGLPPVATYGLTLAPDGRTLYAATHGRGVWSANIARGGGGDGRGGGGGGDGNG
ncbi:MAG: exo-alpha-sialidase [Actinomycetota bacterium]